MLPYKGIRHGNEREPVFTRPGFEKSTSDDRFLLTSHSLTKLLAETEYHHLTAIPRIQPHEPLKSRERWVDLEHARLRAGMLPKPAAPATPSTRRGGGQKPSLEAPACWQHAQAALTGVLPQQQPFRDASMKTTTLAWLPSEDGDDDEDALVPHRVEDLRGGKRGEKLYVSAKELLHDLSLNVAPNISRWGEFDLRTLLIEQADVLDRPLERVARMLTTVEVPESAQGWLWHSWLGYVKKH